MVCYPSRRFALYYVVFTYLFSHTLNYISQSYILYTRNYLTYIFKVCTYYNSIVLLVFISSNELWPLTFTPGPPVNNNITKALTNRWVLSEKVPYHLQCRARSKTSGAVLQKHTTAICKDPVTLRYDFYQQDNNSN